MPGERNFPASPAASCISQPRRVSNIWLTNYAEPFGCRWIPAARPPSSRSARAKSSPRSMARPPPGCPTRRPTRSWRPAATTSCSPSLSKSRHPLGVHSFLHPCSKTVLNTTLGMIWCQEGRSRCKQRLCKQISPSSLFCAFFLDNDDMRADFSREFIARKQKMVWL